jgi:hypothetical protein
VVNLSVLNVSIAAMLEVIISISMPKLGVRQPNFSMLAIEDTSNLFERWTPGKYVSDGIRKGNSEMAYLVST